MTRDLDASNLSAVQADTVAPVLFVELQFDGETVYVHTRLGTITWGGHDWLGVGDLGAVSSVEESSDMSRRTVTYTLTGIQPEYISAALNEDIQGRTAKLYIGFLNLSTLQLVASPELLDQGRMDVPEGTQGKTFTVTIAAESRFSVWERPVVRRFTHADQQTRFPGDNYFNLIEQGVSKVLYWGQKENR